LSFKLALIWFVCTLYYPDKYHNNYTYPYLSLHFDENVTRYKPV
jgi:hypothetical protein